MRRHLAPAAGRIGSRADSLEEHLFRRHAQCEAQSAIAVIREEPVVTGTEGQRCPNLQSLVACARNLKVDFLLPLEQDLPVVDAAGEKHQPINFNELLRGKLAGHRNCSLHASCGNRKSHSLTP